MYAQPQLWLLLTSVTLSRSSLVQADAQGNTSALTSTSGLGSTHRHGVQASGSPGLYSVPENASKQFPLSTIGQLTNGCTGFLIGPCHVMTVAHCVYEPWKNIWWGGLDFYPGRNVPVNSVEGSIAWSPLGKSTKKDVVLHPNWTNAASSKGKPAADAAIIIMNEPIGRQVGWLDYRLPYDVQSQLEEHTAAAITAPGPVIMDQLVANSGLSLHVAGYPDNKPNGSMWEQCCHPIRWDLQGNLLWHDCSVRGGNSGSPVWVEWPIITVPESAAAHSQVNVDQQQQQQQQARKSLRERKLLVQQPQQQGHDSAPYQRQQTPRVQVVAIHSSSLKFSASSDTGAYAEDVYAAEVANQGSQNGDASSRVQCVAGAGGREADGDNVLLPVAVPFTDETYKWIERTLQEHACS